MLTTALIVVPLVGAILVWVLPLSRESTSGLALLVWTVHGEDRH
jgi:NADH:ubiquinone oxidoreductase subunit 4 (subunit M)